MCAIYRKWTPEEDAGIKAMKAAGASFDVIAIKYGVSQSVAKRRYRSMVPYEGDQPNIDLDQLRNMWGNDASYADIAEAFGVSRSIVNRWRILFALPKRAAKLPSPTGKQRPFSDAEKAIIIEMGYSVAPERIAERLPGRSACACGEQRKRLANKGLIYRPANIARRSTAPKATAKVMRGKDRLAVKLAPPPPPKPVRATAPPLPPEPVVRELPPNAIDRPIWRTLPEIKRMAMADRIVMTEAHDLQRYNKLRAEMGKQPVFISPGSLDARF